MKKDDSVFFFTLVDFLLTAIFFGLVLFAVSASRTAKESGEQLRAKAAIDSLVRASGTSDLTELTDKLTRLGPLRDAGELAAFVKAAGGLPELQRNDSLLARAGGRDSVAAALARLERIEGGLGKPPCLYAMRANRKVVIPLATVTASDSAVRFTSRTERLDSVLHMLGRSFESVQELSLVGFHRAFAPLVVKQPACRYSLTFIEHTRYVDARDAARSVFYLNIEHR